MGQYQQWLHYREVDQQLRAQLEALEAELNLLHDRARTLGEPGHLRTDNAIIHALVTSSNGHTSPFDSAPVISPMPTSSPQPVQNDLPETISPLLSAHSRLPGIQSQDIAAETPSMSTQLPMPNATNPLPPLPHSESPLLPEDMAALIDAHAQTDPQLELPWWLRNIAKTSGAPNGPIDQESIRTNRLVQRWLERWGRQSPPQQKPEEGSSS